MQRFSFHNLFNILFLATPFLTGCAAVKYTMKTQPDIYHTPQEYHDPSALLNSAALVYRPSESQESASEEEQLLQQYAPIVVQGVQNNGKIAYSSDSDRIGHPFLIPQANGHYTVAFDCDRPVLYSRVEKEEIYGHPLIQLVYNYWYPRHPLGFAEKGQPDGGVLRVTLDANHQPAVYEYVWPCGCFHTLFVAEEIEREAQAEFADLAAKKDRFTEKNVKGRLDWNVQDLVLGSRTGTRPVLFISAGEHKCEALQTVAYVHNWQNLPSQTYELEPYANLFNVPIQDQPQAIGPIFNKEGLVWGGRRIWEEVLFVGMLHHAGWPRNLDLVKIHWDEDKWTDPHLLCTFLRLPHSMVQSNPKIAEGSTLSILQTN